MGSVDCKWEGRFPLHDLHGQSASSSCSFLLLLFPDPPDPPSLPPTFTGIVDTGSGILSYFACFGTQQYACDLRNSSMLPPTATMTSVPVPELKNLSRVYCTVGDVPVILPSPPPHPPTHTRGEAQPSTVAVHFPAVLPGNAAFSLLGRPLPVGMPGGKPGMLSSLQPLPTRTHPTPVPTSWSSPI
jgi:hypothetical protein